MQLLEHVQSTNLPTGRSETVEVDAAGRVTPESLRAAVERIGRGEVRVSTREMLVGMRQVSGGRGHGCHVGCWVKAPTYELTVWRRA